MEIIEAESAPVASSLRASTWSNPALLIGLGFLVSYGVMFFVAGDLLPQLPRWVLFTLSAFLFLFLFFFPLVTRKQDEPNQFTFPSWKQIFWEAIISIPLIILCLVLTLLTRLAISYFLPDSNLSARTFNPGIGEMGAQSIFILFISVAIVAPLSEEIFFRGFVLPGLVKRFGVGRSLLLSSLVFGLFHIDPGAIVPTFALGLALGWVYLKTGSIWPAMFAHGLHNTVAVLIAKYVTT